MSILDAAERSVQGTGGHTSKSLAAAFTAVALPVLAGMVWLAPHRDVGFALMVTSICLPLSAFSCLMYVAHRRCLAGAAQTPTSPSEVRTLAGTLGVGVALTLLAVVFEVDAVYIMLAIVATAVIAASLVAEVRTRRPADSRAAVAAPGQKP